MTERSVTHSTFVLERTYNATPARVFAAWSTAEALLRWGSPGEGWEVGFDRFDFRVGGGNICRFGPAGGDVYVNDARYQDIVPGHRIVTADTMTCGDKRLFAGLATVEFHPAGAGCRLVFTEQGAFLDGHDLPENHRAGWTEMLGNLDIELRRASAAA